jgi:V-type H+-transporting ATPase subunit a
VKARIEDLKVVLDRTVDHRRRILTMIAGKIYNWRVRVRVLHQTVPMKVDIYIFCGLFRYRSFAKQVIKEKAIYTTMNMFNYDVGRKCLMAEVLSLSPNLFFFFFLSLSLFWYRTDRRSQGWVPKEAIEDVQLCLRRATTRSGANIPSVLTVIQSREEPPTYFKTNKVPLPASCCCGCCHLISTIPYPSSVYRVFPGHCRRVRRRSLPRDQSR